jgi:hypothetical protein
VTNEQGRYLSYLLRMWQTRREGEIVWRTSLESSETGERRGFTSPDALFAFLREQMDSAAGSSRDQNA